MTVEDILARFRAMADSIEAQDYADCTREAGLIRDLCDEIEREQREAKCPDAIMWQQDASAWASEAREAYALGGHGWARVAQYNAAQSSARARRLLGIEEG